MHIYKNLVKEILSYGEEHVDRTGVGTRSLFGKQMEFKLQAGFPLVTVKSVPLRWVAEELFWILSGSTDERVLAAKGVDIWKEWAGEDGDLGPTYGFQLRNFGAVYVPAQTRRTYASGVDQIRRLVEGIQRDPGSRRHVLTYWHPAQVDIGFPPCHVASQFKIHEKDKQISCHLFQRSADAFLGLPFDIASYALLTHLVGKVTGYHPRKLVISLGDVHLYNNHLEQAREMVKRDPFPQPALYLSDELEGKGFHGLMEAHWGQIRLSGYESHGKLAAPVAV